MEDLEEPIGVDFSEQNTYQSYMAAVKQSGTKSDKSAFAKQTAPRQGGLERHVQ